MKIYIYLAICTIIDFMCFVCAVRVDLLIYVSASNVTQHYANGVFLTICQRRQAECAKTARIQMALPAGKSAGGTTNNLYEELGDSTMYVSSASLLSEAKANGRFRKFVDLILSKFFCSD